MEEKTGRRIKIKKTYLKNEYLFYARCFLGSYEGTFRTYGSEIELPCTFSKDFKKCIVPSGIKLESWEGDKTKIFTEFTIPKDYVFSVKEYILEI